MGEEQGRGLRQRQQHSGHFNILPSAIESLRSVHFLIKSALRAGSARRRGGGAKYIVETAIILLLKPSIKNYLLRRKLAHLILHLFYILN